MTDAEKALAACAELVEAREQVKQLSASIGDALQACLTKNDPVDDALWSPLKQEFKTHLARAYEHEVDMEAAYYGVDGRVFLEPEEQQAILAECEHCMAAHEAIQKRKAAKKRLGNARRFVTNIGKRAIKANNNGEAP